MGLLNINVNHADLLLGSQLPAYIVITTPPTELIYHDGETIDKTGMVVTAYKNDGELWTMGGYPDGIIPLSEITLNPATAAYTSQQWKGYQGTAQLEDSGYVFPLPLKRYADMRWGFNSGKNEYIEISSGYGLFVKNGVQAVSDQPFTITEHYWSTNSNKYVDHVISAPGYLKPSEMNGQIKCNVWFNGVTSPDIHVKGDVYTKQTGNHILRDLARICYGDGIVVGDDIQSINVEWHRPVDMEVLSDSFDINVI